MSPDATAATPPGVRGATITGWGTALPPTVVTNAHYEANLATTDEWITDRTGIKERRDGAP
jgi:3-oxoacyl-[acyl-carrier-protein] synthase-3